jgi:hypothetical protein
MHYKQYNQKKVTRNIWGKPDVSFTKGVKNITGISKLAAENTISQNSIQTTVSYWIQYKSHECPSCNEKGRICDYFGKNSICVIRNNK